MAAGSIEAQTGEIFLQPGTTLRYLPQEPDLAGFETTLAYVEAGLGPQDDLYRARYLLEQMSLTGDEDPRTLSGGETRRAALARVLAPAPDILLLDEPTNHLDLPAVEWLEKELGSLRSALVLISHDRRFLETLSRTTVWLDRGRTRRLEKGFAEFEAWRDTIFEQEDESRRKLDRKLEAETDWLHKGVTARRKRNQGRLRALLALREQRRTLRSATGRATLAASEGGLAGKLVIAADSISKSYSGRPIVRDFSLRIQRGDRLGVVGPNGSGKTTLLNLLTGALPPDSGKVQLGTNLQMVTLDQQRESIPPGTTLVEALTGGHGDTVTVAGEVRHVIGYMKDFLFSPEQARTPIGVLSGGERGRLMLARALARPSNLLVLDEPTNDLDLETLDLLQEMLADYAGTVLLVSHDRDFLDRVATSVLAWEGEGLWTEYAGGYSDMVVQRGKGVTAREIVAPKKTKAISARRPVQPTAPGRIKLSFKEKHALETLPKRMDALRADIAAHQTALADPRLFGRDSQAFAKAAEELERCRAELAQAEDDWLALEMRREEADGR